MGQEFINLGTPNLEDGDFTREAWIKAQSNFTELYALQFFTDRILDGSASWRSGLIFDVVISRYVFDGSVLPAANEDGTVTPITEVITLPAADPTNPRIDIIVVDVDGVISSIQGTPASNPAAPTPDFTTQLQITQVLIPAGATEPSGVSREDVYDENTGEPGEWTTTETTGGARIDIGSTTTPNQGSVHIRATATETNDAIQFTNDAPYATNDSTNLVFKIKNNGSTLFNMQIQCLNAGNLRSNTISISDGTYGFDESNTTTYQIISIPGVAFGFTGDCDIIFMRFRGQMNFDIDDVYWSSGNDNPPAGTVDYISNIALNGNNLEVIGVGQAFNGVVDLSSLGGGGGGNTTWQQDYDTASGTNISTTAGDGVSTFDLDLAQEGNGLQMTLNSGTIGGDFGAVRQYGRLTYTADDEGLETLFRKQDAFFTEHQSRLFIGRVGTTNANTHIALEANTLSAGGAIYVGNGMNNAPISAATNGGVLIQTGGSAFQGILIGDPLGLNAGASSYIEFQPHNVQGPILLKQDIDTMSRAIPTGFTDGSNTVYTSGVEAGVATHGGVVDLSLLSLGGGGSGDWQSVLNAGSAGTITGGGGETNVLNFVPAGANWVYTDNTNDAFGAFQYTPANGFRSIIAEIGDTAGTHRLSVTNSGVSLEASSTHTNSMTVDGDTGRITISLASGPQELVIANLPTSAAGLPTGAIWNNGGVLNVA